MALQDTLGNEHWCRKNEDKIKAAFPDTWTHADNLNVVKIGFNLKLAGIEWSSMNELGKIMAFLEKIGILERNGLTVRSNPKSAF